MIPVSVVPVIVIEITVHIVKEYKYYLLTILCCSL